MTTANKPTWNPVKAGSAQFLTGGQHTQQFSSRDMPGNLLLKVRQQGQGTQDEVSRVDLKRIKEKEEELNRMGSSAERDRIKDISEAALQFDDSDYDTQHKRENHALRDDGGGEEEDEEEEDEDEEDEEDEEEELLMRELERIKKEREEERQNEERQRMAEDQKLKQEAALKGNPLMNLSSSSAKLKRRWDDDVVFRNQAKTEVRIPKKRFINDTIRSDFHRKFLEKFVR